MGRMKDLLIDCMNEQKAVHYEILQEVSNGPDDFEWEVVATFKDYMRAIEYATSLHTQGRTVKLYDPFVSQDYYIPFE